MLRNTLLALIGFNRTFMELKFKESDDLANPIVF